MSSFIMIRPFRRKLPKPFLDGVQKFLGAQKLLKGHDASASLRHPQMAPAVRHDYGNLYYSYFTV